MFRLLWIFGLLLGTSQIASGKDVAASDPAIERLNAVLAESPLNVSALAARGNAWIDLGEYAKAIDDLSMVLRLRPEAYRIYNQRGLAKSRQGELKGAIADFNRALKIKPDYGIAHYNRGHVFYQRSRYARAIGNFDEAIRLFVNDAASYNNRGLSHYARGDYETALTDFNEAARHAPDVAIIYNNRARVWRRIGNETKAIADFQKASSLDGMLKTSEEPRDGAADSNSSETASIQEEFEEVWRSMAVAKASQPDPAKEQPDSRVAVEDPIDEPLVDAIRSSSGLKADPELIAAIGVFTEKQIKQLEAKKDSGPDTKAEKRKSPLDQIKNHPFRGVYRLRDDRLTLLGTSALNLLQTGVPDKNAKTTVRVQLTRASRSPESLVAFSDLAKLQGTWRIASARYGKERYDKVGEFLVEFRNDQVIMRGNRDAQCQFRIALNESASPKRFDLVLLSFRAAKSARERIIQGSEALSLDYSSGVGTPDFETVLPERKSRRSVFGTLAKFAGGLFLLGILAHYGNVLIARGGQGARVSAVARTEPTPTRLHLVLLALFVTLLAACEIVTTFQFKPLALSDALHQFSRVSFLATSISHLGVWLRDLFFALCIGFCWMGVLAVDVQARKQRLLHLTTLVVVGVALRLVLEFFDSWLNANSSLVVDLVPEALGILAGGLLWLAIGRRLVDWLRSMSTDCRRPTWIDWVLLAYFAGFLLCMIWPLDVTIRGADLARKYRDGLIAFVPFAEANVAGRFLFGTLLVVPVGALLATASTRWQQPVRSKESVLVLSLGLLASIELFQLLLIGHYATSTDVLSGLVGAALGAMIMFRWYGDFATRAALRQRQYSTKYWTRIAPYLAATALYAVALLAVSCLPFQPIGDIERIDSRYAQLFNHPFSVFWQSSLWDCFADGLIQAIVFAPLGVFWAVAVIGPTIPSTVRGILLACAFAFFATLGLSIELIQVYLPSRVPGLFDVFTGTLGAGLAMLATAAWMRYRVRRTALGRRKTAS